MKDKELRKLIGSRVKQRRLELNLTPVSYTHLVQEAQSSQQTAEVKKQRTRLATAKQRVSELEVLLLSLIHI